ncbi:MAG: hypothetical protein IJX89_04105 [Alphaproteobacteria bacterium]|nr:hypothetical protein [Alphaproteobacteria bacterium]
MRNKLDNILLGILWLLAVTLGTSFWFNTQFGFNIFSSAHWQYLAYMQASQMPVKPMFYGSMFVIMFIAIFGLYLLIRPRFRKIKLPVRHITNTPTTPQSAPAASPAPTPQLVAQTTIAPTQAQPTPQIPDSGPRPPRLNIPTISARPIAQPIAQQPSPTPAQNSPQTDWPELRQIFESAGYTVKTAPHIGTLQTSLLAIGTNETLYIGAVGVPTAALQTAIEKLTQVFSDTLDDIVINITGFIIAAPDATTTNTTDILLFDTPGALREYMTEHPNAPLPDDDGGNFDAFSAYISTVIDYIGKI